MRRLPDSGRGAAVGVVSSGLLAAQGLGFLVSGTIAQAIGPQATVGAAGAAGLCSAAILTRAWSQARPGRAETGTLESAGHIPAATAVEPEVAD